MAEVLSQNEIDSLLSEMTSGRINVDEVLSKTSTKGDIASYDFRRPNRISKNQVRTLQNIHENFAEIFGYYLVSKLQTVVSISVTSVDQLFYSEFILSVSNPSCLYVFDIEGTDGSGIMEISPQLALTLLERLLGGTADVPPKPRTITPIEQAVVRGIVEHALSDLRNAWKSIAELNFKFSRLEMEADFVQVAPSSEIVVVVSFDVNIGMHTYLMNLCFPTFALEEVLARLNRQQVTSTAIKQSKARMKENRQALQQHMSNTYLPLFAELGRTSLTVGEIMQLKEGDVIKIEKRINHEIEVIIAGRRKLAARPGSVDGKKAIRVTRLLNEEDLVDQDLTFKEERSKMTMTQEEIDELIRSGGLDDDADNGGKGAEADYSSADSPEFSNMEYQGGGGSGGGGGTIYSPLDPKLELLYDLQLPVSIELGRTNMLIRDILRLGRGSVIEFDKLVSEPVDVLINGKKVAEGEVVVIDKHFGIRITTLVDPTDRLRGLRK